MMNFKVIAISGGIILALVGLLSFQQVKLERAMTERKQAIDYTLAQDDSLEYLTTTLGQVTSRSKVLDLTIRNLERLQSDRDLAWIKEIRGINKRMNNVEQITTTTARAVGSFRIGLKDTVITLPPLDTVTIPITVRAKLFDNKNEWFRVRGYAMPDTLVVTPEVYVPLQSVVYWERRKFLGLKIGRKDWFKQTTSKNPYVTITADELIRVSKRKPK